MIYVTDFRQELHFKHLFAILKKFGYDFSDKLVHVGFGTINFGKEIMATRKGKIILLEDVLRKTIEKAEEEIKKRETKGDAEKVGVGAIKYAILKNDPKRDVNFSWEQALNFEGNTGPYLQYSYARASSILKKSKNKQAKKIKQGKFKPDKEEIKIIKMANDFPEIIKKSAEELNPAIIANYCFELAQAFNEFYHACPVIGSEKEEFRLNVVKIFRQVIGICLDLLGIETMEEM
jgi:arginyl-tRNA synthetase